MTSMIDEPARTDTVQVRPAAAADVATVVALDGDVTGLAKPRYWRDIFARYGDHEQRFFLVAETAGVGAAKVVGFIVGEARAWEFGSPPCGWVFAVTVDPKARLEGVGSRLLDEIAACFRGAGMDKMRTMLSRDNHLLMSFFRSNRMMAGPYIQLEKDLDQGGGEKAP